MSTERIEAAAKAQFERDMSPIELTWGDGSDDLREWYMAGVMAALAAADAVMFSEEAIERAAKTLMVRLGKPFSIDPWDETTEAARDEWKNDIRAVVAALRGGAA